MNQVITGLDLLVDDPAPVAGRRWALLCNHAAVTSQLQPARTALQAAGLGPLIRLFAPEHGLEGTAQDMEAVADQRDPVTGLPVRSLYGTTAATLEPRPEDLESIEAVVVDLPDIGTRYYTFAATMEAMMPGCEREGIEMIVLDRPNPIGGLLREGGLVQPGFESFVSQLPTPIRHGLTIGELALLLQQERYPGLELTVLTCQGWQRHQWWDETGLPWVPPSPNMPAVETAAIYPGICLIEATTLSEGRGTTRPFHLVGAPWIDQGVLAERLGAMELAGVGFRPACFRPMFGKHAGEECRGVEIHVRDRLTMRPLAMGLSLLKVIYDLYPKSFSWRRDPYEFVSDIPALDLLTGSQQARDRIESGRPLEPLLASWGQEVEEFNAGLTGLLLY
jgi:uncharacterized protein YbbC (DUF1343 family)